MQGGTSRTQSIWKSRLGSAFRTGFACAIVGCISLFGPLPLQHMLAFPALAYVTVILIVSEATLGDALHGCWNAIYATLQGAVPAILILWLLGNARFWVSTAVFAVTVSTFIIVLPESTHMIAKRIALAQIVILYSVTTSNGLPTGHILHPAHVAVSTLIAAFASLLALLIPFPRLACREVKKKNKLLSSNVSERLKLYVRAFCAENDSEKLAYVAQAKSLSHTGNSLLQIIKLKQGSMQWERPLCISSQVNYMKGIEKVQAHEHLLGGMETALTSSPLFPVIVSDQELSNHLLHLKVDIISLESEISPESENKSLSLVKFLQSFQPSFPTQNELPYFFFLFCMELLQGELFTTRVEETQKSVNLPKQDWKTAVKSFAERYMSISNERILQAVKCSLSLGLAVLFGMIFSKENGYWSGLTVAVGMGFGREATFKIANLKAQGTVLGCIYGVLCSFIFKGFLELRFVSLLPWIIFTSFLRTSRMYGPPGAASAVIGALIVLGRKNYGPADKFAIVRITEAFIGLTCSIIVELLLRQKRPNTLSRIRLSESLGALHECISSLSFHVSGKIKHVTSLSESKDTQKKLKIQVSALHKIIEEAEAEPNFWFTPFSSSCYGKLYNSLSKMSEHMFFATSAVEFLLQEFHTIGHGWKGNYGSIDEVLEHFRFTMGSSIKFLQKITLVMSLAALESDIRRKDISYDLELGKLPHTVEDEMQKITDSFLKHSREIIDSIEASGVEDSVKTQMILGLSTLGFSMHGLMKETRELEKSVKDLIQWENPTRHVNLNEIYCKVISTNT